MVNSDKDAKTWVKPVLITVAIGLLLIGAIAWLLIGKAPHKRTLQETVSEASDDSGLAPLQTARRNPPPVQQTQDPATASPPSQPGLPPTAAPPSDPSQAQGEQPPRQRRQYSSNPQQPGEPSAQASPDSPTQNQNQRQRVSRKDRIEKTAPEDRARMVQMRIDEMKYRAANGGGGGGGRPRP